MPAERSAAPQPAPVATGQRGRAPREDAPVPAATVARLPRYLRALNALAAAGASTVSSRDLAAAAGSQPAQLRRDLSYFGSLGVRGVGYHVATLRAALGEHVGAAQSWPIVIVGAGNLGSALARQFSRPPFRIAAVVDSDPALAGASRAGVPVRPQHELRQAVVESGAILGVVATPGEVAQAVVDALVAAGVHSILSFAPAVVSVPAGVSLRAVDLVQELQILAFHEQHRDA